MKTIANESDASADLKSSINALTENSKPVSVGLSANMLMEKLSSNAQTELTAKLVSSGTEENKAAKIAGEMIASAVDSVSKPDVKVADFSSYGEAAVDIYNKFTSGEYGGRALISLAETVIPFESGIDSEDGQGYNDNIGDEVNGYSNTELLEGRTVSASRGGGDGLRQQSANSEKLSSFVGNVQFRQGQRQAIRAGDSGWLSRSMENVSEQEGDRFNESIRGEISGAELKPTDTAGRTLSAELIKKLKDTIFKDENGRILSLYHWTKEVFDAFSKGEFGFHFGTLDAARDRYLQLKEENPQLENGIYKEVYLNITNPLSIDFDADEWCAYAVIYQLRKNGEINEADYNRIKGMDGIDDPSYDNPAAVATRELLKQKGYDGVIYYNESENQGSLSVIALYPEQIITVAENGVLKEGVGVTEESADSSAFSEPDIKNPKETALSAMQRVVSGGRKITTEEQQKLKFIGKKLGVGVEFDYEGEGNGYYENGVIHLNPNNCKSPLKFIFKHELMHHFENSRLYGKFQKYLFEDSAKFKEWLETKGKSLEGYRNDVRTRYRNAGLTDTLIKNGNGSEIDGANFEIVADFMGDALFGSNEGDITARFLSELQKENRNFVERIADWFKSVIARLKGTEVEKDLIKLQQKVLRLKETANIDEKIDKGKQFSLSESQLAELKTRPGLITKLSESELKDKYRQEFNEDSLRELTEKERSNLMNSQDVVVSSDYNDRLDFIYKSIFDKKFDKRLIVGKITPNLAQRIKQYIGKDYTGYNVVLRSGDIRHNEHFFDTHSGINITINDIADSVFGLTDFNVISLSDKFNVSMNSFPYVLEYEQNGKVKEAIVSYSKTKRSLAVFDIYIKRSNLPKTVDNSNTAPNPTSKTAKGANASNTMVSQTKPGVNNYSMQPQQNNASEEIAKEPKSNTDTQADLEESAFSMSEKGPQYSLPTEEEKIQINEAHEKWKNGEITNKEYGKILADITGALPKGENPKVDVTLPEKVGDRYVHRFDRTFLESGHAPEEVSEGIAKDILEGARTFERISNKSLVARAENRIERDPQGALEEWMKAVNSGKMLSAYELVLGQQLMLSAKKVGENSPTFC